MAINKVFRDIAIDMSRKQPEMVDQLLEEAPILEMMPMQEASHGLWNVYEEQGDVTGAGLVDADDELPEVDNNSELKQTDLSILGGKDFVGEDKAKKMGGASAYFQRRQASIFRKSGMDAEQSIIYNNIRKFAEDSNAAGATGNYGPRLIDAQGANNTNYSILAVKWVPGETTGLFDPSAGNGFLMDSEPINGGNLFEKENNGKQVLSYGVRYKSYVGIQLANARYVSSIVNIDTALGGSDIPTARQLDDLVAGVRGATGNTFLYMHPRVATALNDYKGAQLQTTVETQNFNRTFQAWNGIPIVTSYNFLNGTEQNVTV